MFGQAGLLHSYGDDILLKNVRHYFSMVSGKYCRVLTNLAVGEKEAEAL